jgi:hypothetical protein
MDHIHDLFADSLYTSEGETYDKFREEILSKCKDALTLMGADCEASEKSNLNLRKKNENLLDLLNKNENLLIDLHGKLDTINGEYQREVFDKNTLQSKIASLQDVEIRFQALDYKYQLLFDKYTNVTKANTELKNLAKKLDLSLKARDEM